MAAAGISLSRCRRCFGMDDSLHNSRAINRRLRGNIDKIVVAEENIINLTGFQIQSITLPFNLHNPYYKVSNRYVFVFLFHILEFRRMLSGK
jgi:hypothetical protein